MLRIECKNRKNLLVSDLCNPCICKLICVILVKVKLLLKNLYLILNHFILWFEIFHQIITDSVVESKVNMATLVDLHLRNTDIVKTAWECHEKHCRLNGDVEKDHFQSCSSSLHQTWRKRWRSHGNSCCWAIVYHLDFVQLKLFSWWSWFEENNFKFKFCQSTDLDSELQEV